jgi:hypothetical protein
MVLLQSEGTMIRDIDKPESKRYSGLLCIQRPEISSIIYLILVHIFALVILSINGIAETTTQVIPSTVPSTI